jgi:transposase
MLTLPPSVRVFVASMPVDARKSFDGLAAIVESEFGKDPLTGHLFVFLNRRRHVAQILFWDRTGYCLVRKRLEAGTFRFACATEPGATHVEVSALELTLMLEGIDLAGASRRRRYVHPEPTSPKAA